MPDEIKDFTKPFVSPAMNPFSSGANTAADNPPNLILDEPRVTATDAEIERTIDRTLEMLRDEDEPVVTIDGTMDKIGQVLRNKLDGRQFVQAMVEIRKILS